MEMVKKVKAVSPSTFIVLGGYTASFFHEEIMKNFDAVDGIIRGEGRGSHARAGTGPSPGRQ